MCQFFLALLRVYSRSSSVFMLSCISVCSAHTGSVLQNSFSFVLAIPRLGAFLIWLVAAFHTLAASMWKLGSDFFSLHVSLNTLLVFSLSSCLFSLFFVLYGSKFNGDPFLYNIFQTSISLIFATSWLTDRRLKGPHPTLGDPPFYS